MICINVIQSLNPKLTLSLAPNPHSTQQTTPQEKQAVYDGYRLLVICYMWPRYVDDGTTRYSSEMAPQDMRRESARARTRTR